MSVNSIRHISFEASRSSFNPLIVLVQRLVQDVQIYVEQLGDECAANVAVTRCANSLSIDVVLKCCH